MSEPVSGSFLFHGTKNRIRFLRREVATFTNGHLALPANCVPSLSLSSQCLFSCNKGATQGHIFVRRNNSFSLSLSLSAIVASLSPHVHRVRVSGCSFIYSPCHCDVHSHSDIVDVHEKNCAAVENMKTFHLTK